MRIVFWLEELSLHFSATIRAMAESHEVTVVAQEELQERRRDLGWVIPDFGKAKIVVGPDAEAIGALVAERASDHIHILVGTRGEFFEAVTAACLYHRARFGVYGEAPHPEGLRVVGKWGLYALKGLRLSPRIGFFLALGRGGVRWYKQCGYPPDKLFPCAYATEDPPNPIETPQGEVDGTMGPYRIVFAGRCQPIKQVDLALRALSRVPRGEWSFAVIGDGPAKPEWQQLAQRLGLADQVTFHPRLPYRQAVAQIQRSDLLLLPSRHEGWGAVVNEALMSGVPVVCSDTCAAADLLGGEWRGAVFKSGDEVALARELSARVNGGRKTRELSRRIREWSRNISGAAVAGYIQSVLEHVYDSAQRPVPPWFLESEGGDHR